MNYNSDRGYGLFENGIGSAIVADAIENIRRNEEEFINDQKVAHHNDIVYEFNAMSDDFDNLKKAFEQNLEITEKVVLYAQKKEKEVDDLKQRIRTLEEKNGELNRSLELANLNLKGTKNLLNISKRECELKAKSESLAKQNIENLLTEKAKISELLVSKITEANKQNKLCTYICEILMLRSKFLNNSVNKMVEKNLINLNELRKEFDLQIRKSNMMVSQGVNISFDQKLNWIEKNSPNWFLSLSNVLDSGKSEM